jgi:hypothetical protein
VADPAYCAGRLGGTPAYQALWCRIRAVLNLIIHFVCDRSNVGKKVVKWMWGS